MPRNRSTDLVVEELRARLARIDRTLVLGLQARERAQRALFAHKRTKAIALSDLEQERLVRRRARAWAKECGADPDLAEHVIGLAIASGKRRFRAAVASPRQANSPVSGVPPLHLGRRSRTPGPARWVSAVANPVGR